MSGETEAVVRVRLDTGQASRELDKLTKDADKSSGRIGKKLRKAVGKGLGVVGLGGAVGGTLAAIRGASQSGLGDVIGEAFGGIGAELANTLFGELDERARASKAAREETIAAFGAQAGLAGKIPPGAKNFFDQVQSLRVQEEKGRDLFNRDDRFRSVGAKEMVDQVMNGLGKLLSDAVSALGDKLIGFISGK